MFIEVFCNGHKVLFNIKEIVLIIKGDDGTGLLRTKDGEEYHLDSYQETLNILKEGNYNE